MDEATIKRLMRRQAGVICRRQVLGAAGSDRAIARLVRRREWARVHEGVYAEHTGPLTRRQQEWAAVLVHEGAVLAGRSALRAHGLTVDERHGRRDVVELAVDRSHRVSDPVGVHTIQLRNFKDLVQRDTSPPRLRLEPAALLVASGAPSEDAAVAVLADAVRSGLTTPARLRAWLERFPRLPRRRLLIDVLSDVAEGVESALERRYLRDVERAHGLPTGERQVTEATQVVEHEVIRVVRRDVRYRGQDALVELDGVLGHAAALDRWSDLDRDLAAALHGSVTLRAGWSQVLAPCRLAVIVAAVLTARGWTGTPRPCGAGCAMRPARIA